MRCFLAIDIGASSGRHIVGWRENGEIRTDEIYRFPNGVKQMGGHLIWDMEQLPEDVKAGITAAKAKYPRIESLSISQETNMKAAFDAAANGGLRTIGDYFRCAYRSLAESYRVALEELERNTGKKYSRLYIPLMDNGHYHPAEVVSDKIPALLSFFPEIALQRPCCLSCSSLWRRKKPSRTAARTPSSSGASPMAENLPPSSPPTCCATPRGSASTRTTGW